jgi:hypothetical protein
MTLTYRRIYVKKLYTYIYIVLCAMFQSNVVIAHAEGTKLT